MTSRSAARSSSPTGSAGSTARWRRAPKPPTSRCCGGAMRSTATCCCSGWTRTCSRPGCRRRSSTTCCSARASRRWAIRGRALRPAIDWVGMPDRLVREFPLFPLGLVALPSELIPLHIFEQRYKAMMNECLRDEREFGILWLADDGLREIGCACEIAEVIERMDDGRMNLVARGTRPFRVLERQGHLAYPAGVVEFLDDREGEIDADVAAAAHEAYADLVRRATDRDPTAEELAELSAYAMAATVDFGLDAKQGLLDLRSENARLRLVTRLFRAAIKRLDFVDRAQARARSNGRVRLR